MLDSRYLPARHRRVVQSSFSGLNSDGICRKYGQSCVRETRVGYELLDQSPGRHARVDKAEQFGRLTGSDLRYGRRRQPRVSPALLLHRGECQVAAKVCIRRYGAQARTHFEFYARLTCNLNDQQLPSVT